MSADLLHTRHERLFEANRYVYPVLSRRAGGLSIGVNLNPDKICNFDCLYCQVDRIAESERRSVATDVLLAELDQTLHLAESGRIYTSGKFCSTPAALRRLNDIAFSGDGEPTTCRNFDEILDACAAVKRRHGLSNVKMVLLTNASMFHRPHVQRGLTILDANQGEIWAKLDAGTAAYFEQIDRTRIGFARILQNLREAACVRPLVIQALFLRLHGQPPPYGELEAFCERLNDITAAGGTLSLVQVYTIARPPAEPMVTPLTDAEVDAIAELVRARTGLPVAAFYGTTGVRTA